MEFRAERSAFTEAVAWAARVLPTRSPVPVLGGLLLEATGDTLRISGLDYEASARVEVPTDTVSAGKVLVMGRRLLDICRVLPEGPVECAVEGTRFTVSGAGTRFGLSVLPLDDYPALPELPELRGAVDASEFAAAVAHVAVAAGRDDALPVLTGIRLGLDGGTMTLAATDRYRFAVRTLGWKPESHDVSADVVVSARRLTEIARSLGLTGTVRVGLGEGSVGFEHAGMRTTVRLLDGRLPRHDKLFTMREPVVAVTDRAPLLEAVKRVAVVAEGDSPVRLDFSSDAVHLRAGYEDDVASQRLPVTLLEGAEALTVAFNPAYLTDALSAIDDPVVRFDLLGPGQRALLTGLPTAVAEPDQAHRHLLMSVKPLL
ncbi:DNA polymerase III subunit beta [Streptomyces sp. NBC_01387]|uniref:DNA polymerase III subunit beta n=1 Tax=unclassified Streptomyces TaxID=2593676 RepID=UPI002025887B|nr:MULTISPECIES: DNA polymerase III subunit beta [unclassified Streptomyces]MCX4548613.1 DNA polymerase III subunit beta [Streptomyces sp. NBC_01500]